MGEMSHMGDGATPSDIKPFGVTFVALPPRGIPRWLWVSLVSATCHIKLNDDVESVPWGSEMKFELFGGRHRVEVFHELGTISAPARTADIDVMGPLHLQFRARFWPFKPGELTTRPGP